MILLWPLCLVAPPLMSLTILWGEDSAGTFFSPVVLLGQIYHPFEGGNFDNRISLFRPTCLSLELTEIWLPLSPNAGIEGVCTRPGLVHVLYYEFQAYSWDLGGLVGRKEGKEREGQSMT